MISPTRELAQQIERVARPLVASLPWLRHATLVGGSDPSEDVALLRKSGAHLLIGTPGRLSDVLRRAPWLDCKSFEALVLDEADRLLDMGFGKQLDAVLQRLPRQRRTGLFSATQTEAVAALARAGLRNPVRVQVATEVVGAKGAKGGPAGGPSSGDDEAAALAPRTPGQLSLQYAIARSDDTTSQLFAFLCEHRDDKVLVYFLTCAAVDWAVAMVNSKRGQAALRAGVRAAMDDTSDGATNDAASSPPLSDSASPDALLPLVTALHGKMPQRARAAALEAWAPLSRGALFTTDLAARGLDFPDVDWVVQVDAPTDPDAFVHRVGRTARAGRSGNSLALLAPNEEPYVDFLARRRVPLSRAAAYPTPRELDRRREDEETANGNGANGNDARGKGTKGKKTDKPNASGRFPSSSSGPSPALPSQPSSVSLHPLPRSSLPDWAAVAREAAEADRAVMDLAVRAFVSHVRGYKEHSCGYIFRLQELDAGRLAQMYGVLRMPSVPDLKRADASAFCPSTLDPDDVPYLDKTREKARLARAAAERQRRAESRATRERESQRREREAEAARAPGARLTAAKRRALAARDDADELKREYAALRKRKRGEIDEREYERLVGWDAGKGEVAAAAGDAGLDAEGARAAAEKKRAAKRQKKKIQRQHARMQL